MSTRGTVLLRLIVCAAVALPSWDVSVFAQSADPAAPPDQEPPAIGALPEGWSRRGDTGVTTLPGGKFAFGVQYRLVYDNSNLAGPGGSTPGDTTGYDFFRQRVRLNLEAAPNDRVGAFVQAEFRGGWGGTAPIGSDPRGVEPTRNPFNRIGDRGLRYTYLYWKPASGHQLLGGILPVSDEFADTLFSADWDWNAGGFAWLGSSGSSRWRAGVLNMIEGVGSSDPDVVDRDGTMILADYLHRSQAAQDDWALDWSAHAYGLVVQENLPLGGTQDFWLGPTLTLRRNAFALRTFAIINTGDLGSGLLAPDGTVIAGFTDAEAQSHTGVAFRAEVEQPIGGVRLKGQVVYTTGDAEGEVGDRFVTPQGLFGTSGYWGYTHIFTANGPSDVNDLGLEIGNGGAGLLTTQFQGSIPLRDGLGLDLSAGWFRADAPRNTSRDMGYEFAGTLRIHVSGPFNVDAGAAYAGLGRFYGIDNDGVYELFARFQLQY